MIRHATVDDAAAVAAVHTRARDAGYRHFAKPVTLATDASQWAERLAGAQAVTWVYEREGRILGFASMADVEDEDLLGEPLGELFALYVDPDAWKRGVGGALLSHAVEQRRARGDAGVVLWVFAENTRARDFYEHRGWMAEPATLESVPERGGAPELRYRLDL